MGAEVAALALQAGLSLASSSQSSRRRRAQQKALELRIAQQKIAAEQQNMNALKQLEFIMSKQNALAAARGIASTSGTLQNIQDTAFKDFDEAVKSRRLSTNFSVNALNQSIDMVKGLDSAFQVGNIFDFAVKGFQSIPAGTFGGNK